MKFAKPIVMAIAALAVVGALFYALMDKSSAPAATFTTLEGQQIALNDLRGQFVLVNFWATSCPGCIKEMPEMIETYNQYKGRGFEVIAVAMSYDPPNYVSSFVETRQLPFPVVLDKEGALARMFGNVQVTPTTFLIGKDGSVLEQKLGDYDFVKLKAMLDKELT